MREITIWTTAEEGDIIHPWNISDDWDFWDEDTARENAACGGYRLLKLTLKVVAVEEVDNS